MPAIALQKALKAWKTHLRKQGAARGCSKTQPKEAFFRSQGIEFANPRALEKQIERMPVTLEKAKAKAKEAKGNDAKARRSKKMGRQYDVDDHVVAQRYLQYVVARLAADEVSIAGSRVIVHSRKRKHKTHATGLESLNAFIDPPLRKAWKCPDPRVKHCVLEAVSKQQRVTRLESVELQQFHRVMDNRQNMAMEQVLRHCDGNVWLEAVHYALYHRTRSPVTTQWFVDHSAQLKAAWENHGDDVDQFKSAVIDVFVGTYDVPSLCLSSDGTRGHSRLDRTPSCSTRRPSPRELNSCHLQFFPCSP